MLPKYDALPMELRLALAEAAAQYPKAPGAEAFVIRCLKDNTTDKDGFGITVGQRIRMIHRLKLPLTPRLRKALEELKKGLEPQMIQIIDDVIKRLEGGGRGSMNLLPPDF